MSDIKLNFINQSNDTNNSQVVIFQKNIAANFEEYVVAWTVISNCSVGSHHPFVYPFQSSVGAEDSWGNFTPLISANNGDAFGMSKEPSGDVLKYIGPSLNHNEIEIRNNLEHGSINALLFKDEKLIAVKNNVVPGQKAVFSFTPSIWIGAVPQIEQGQIMDEAILQSINTQISLLGVAAADIIMSGGGTGPSAVPFSFALSNVRFATAIDADNNNAAEQVSS